MCLLKAMCFSHARFSHFSEAGEGSLPDLSANAKRGGQSTRVTKGAKAGRNPILQTDWQDIAITWSNYSIDAK